MYISDTKVYYDKLIEHDLSLLEYCVADYIYKLSETAGNKKDGYCYMSKKKLAETFLISERTIYRITKRLVAKSVIVKSGESYLKVTNWETKGNYYYIRHKLMEDLKIDETIKKGGSHISMEEYAIMDMALNHQKAGQKIKLNEIQRRLNCSKMSMNNYMNKINRHPAVGYLNGRFFIKDLFFNMYIDTETKKKMDDLRARYGQLTELLFDENGEELP